MSVRKVGLRQSEQGFTIVELLIATMVFSTILVIITSGVVHFTSTYYKGARASSTQTTTRTVMNTIAQNIQYGGGEDSLNDAGKNASGGQYICIGQTQINYMLGGQLGSGGGSSPYGVFITTVDPVTGCKPYITGKAGKELLAPNMRLTSLRIDKSTGSTVNLYTVTASVAYGDIDLLCTRSVAATAAGGCNESATALTTGFDWANLGTTIACKKSGSSQFCATSKLSTQVVSRYESVN